MCLIVYSKPVTESNFKLKIIFRLLNNSKISLIFGVVWLVIGLGFWLIIPYQANHDGLQPQEGIVFAHSNHLKHISITIDLVTTTNPQYMNIFYSYTPIEQKNGTVAIMLPYEGTLIDNPIGWEKHKFQSGSTVIFKNVTCSLNNCLPDNGNLKFNITGSIDSFKIPNQHLQIQFSQFPIDQHIMEFIKEVSDPTEIVFGWNDVDAQLKITIDKQFDQLDAHPEPRLLTFPNSNGGNNLIFNWKINPENSIFLAQYSRYDDRSFAEIRQTMIGFALGSFLSMIIAGISFKQGERDKEKLQNFIKIQRHMQDANTAYLLKKFENAKISYDLAIKIDMKNIDSILLAGNSFFELKRYSDAISYYTKVLEIDPQHIGALNNSATCHDKMENFEKGIELFEKALEVDKNHVDTLNNFGALTLDIGLPDCALPFFNEVLRINRFDAVALTNQGRSLKAIAKERASQNRPSDAENLVNESRRIFEESLQINPDSASTLTALGELYFELGYYDEAYACFNRSMKIEPLEIGNLYNVGIALYKLNKLQDAILFFDEYLVLRPNDITALTDKGVTLSKLNRDIEAIAVYNKILDIEPNNADVIHNRNISHIKLQSALVRGNWRYRIF